MEDSGKMYGDFIYEEQDDEIRILKYLAKEKEHVDIPGKITSSR